MNNKLLSLSAISIAVLISACATPHSPPPELIAARAAVLNAETDSRVLSHAPLELKKATDALSKANELSAKRGTLQEIASLSYVAERHAQTARAIAVAKGNDEAIKSAEADRERARADARSAEAARAQAQAAAARADASTARVDATVARADASVAREQAGDAEARAAAARMQAATAQASAAQAQQQASALQQQLSELQAKQTDRGMLVTLGDLLFEFGRAEIKPSGGDALRKLATYLNEHPDRRILIEGYTDSIGSDAANMTLSQRRAEAVATALAGLGVSWGRITTKGYGPSYPVASNTTDTNRALNRRVEVYISDGDRPVRARG